MEFSLNSLMLTQNYGRENNRRTDEYGEKLYLFRLIATEVRRYVPRDLILGVKLKSVDFVDRKVVATSDEKALRDVGDFTN